jgi:hypothetical protein
MPVGSIEQKDRAQRFSRIPPVNAILVGEILSVALNGSRSILPADAESVLRSGDLNPPT